VDPSTGFPDQGYPGGYAPDLARARHLVLIDLACPGESTSSMVGKPAQAGCGADYHAELGASSQLGAALGFLSAHKGQVALVTIDLGANDFVRCTANGAPDTGCLRTGATVLVRELPFILNKLKGALAVLDPGTRLMGMNYYDPFLGLAFRPGGAKASAEAFLSLVVVEIYDRALDGAYRHAGAEAADVASAFGSGQTTPPEVYGSKKLPRDVASVCRWTWMCPVSPASVPDVHPNVAGYRVIAGAFEKVLARS